MIFELDQPLDDNLLSLVKNFKREIKKTPHVKWVTDRHSWLVGLMQDEWVSHPLSICYHWIEKRKYELIAEFEDERLLIGSFFSQKEAIDAFQLYRFIELGVRKEIIEFLVNKTKNPHVSMQDAVNSISKETEIAITNNEMITLNIDTEQRGTIYSKRFGI